MTTQSDHYLTGEHQQLREEVRAFALEKVAPHIVAMETTREVQHDLVRQIAREGWLGLTIPRVYHGLGAGHLAKTIAIEQISRVSAAMGAALQASQLGAAMVINHGSEEQKLNWLPRIASGECLPTIAVTERESGGHVMGMQTTARRAGRHYFLSGSKLHVGNSEVGDLHGVVARTDSKDGKPVLSAFLVEADAPGLLAVRRRTAMGLHGFSFDELIFEDCRVHVRNRLGDIGEGRDIAYTSSVTYGRPNLTAVALGIHQATYEEAVRVCNERHRYGNPLGNVGVVRDRLGGIYSRLMTCRSLAYEAAHLLDAGHPCDAQLMNAKLMNETGAMDSARDALEIAAADGLFTDSPLERYYRDAPHIYAPAGTGDIQRHRLGEMALGLGRDQWSEQFSAALTTT